MWLARAVAVGRSVRGEGPVTLREIRVAFFRNLDLGQARSHSPTSSQLLDAFVRAGARAPSHVGTNGTVVYYHPTGPSLPRRVVKLLTAECGYHDMATVRSGRALLDLERHLRGLDDGEVILYDTTPASTSPLPSRAMTASSSSPLDHRRAITKGGAHEIRR